MHVLWLSGQSDLIREIKGFARAFQRAGATLVFPDSAMPPDVDIRRLIDLCPEPPSLIVHPEPFLAILPRGLTEVTIPTVGFQCDVYAYTHRRLLYSMLFDYVAILHPGFGDVFRRAGHPSALDFCFGVDQQEFFDSGEVRVIEVASVGRLHPAIYKTRLEVLTSLSREFKMNEWYRFHNFETIPSVYRTSKIVVNVPRDDYPQDANLRAFEALASGALLITRIPSEITTLGFEEDVHFCGYRDPGEIPHLVRKFLADESARFRIAQAGRQKVLREHTYDARVARFLEQLRCDNGKLNAPARSWSSSRVHLAYLDYYAGNGLFGCAKEDLWAILKRASPECWNALGLLSRSGASRIVNHLRFRGTSFWPSTSKT